MRFKIIHKTHIILRIPKSWKRMKDPGQDKDAESKRPPWRAVSISTLPKPDKNALLRAKLLDASRLYQNIYFLFRLQILFRIALNSSN